MLTQKHIIRKQTLELTLPEQNHAWQLQQKIAEVYRGKVLPKLDELFSQFSDPETFFKIERLQIDLGRISLAHLEEDFTQKVQECIYEELSKRVHQTQSEPHPPKETVRPDSKLPSSSVPFNSRTDDCIISQKEYTLELLQHFLRTGTFPWWAEKPPSFDSLEKALFELLKSDRRNIQSFIEEELLHENARHRLIYQFPDPLLWKVVELIVPEKARQFQDWNSDFFTVYAQTQVLSIPESEFRIVVWDAVLAELLTHTVQESTEREILQLIFKSLAQRQHVTYLTLIQSLQNALERLLQSQFVFQSPLPELIKRVFKSDPNFAISIEKFTTLLSTGETSIPPLRDTSFNSPLEGGQKGIKSRNDDQIPQNNKLASEIALQHSAVPPEKRNKEPGSNEQKENIHTKITRSQFEVWERTDSDKRSSSLAITGDSSKQHVDDTNKALHSSLPNSKEEVPPSSKGEFVLSPSLREPPFNSLLEGGQGGVRGLNDDQAPQDSRLNSKTSPKHSVVSSKQSDKEPVPWNEQKENIHAKTTRSQAEVWERVDSDKRSSNLTITEDSSEQHVGHANKTLSPSIHLSKEEVSPSSKGKFAKSLDLLPDKVLHPSKPFSKKKFISNLSLRETSFNSPLEGGQGGRNEFAESLTQGSPLEVEDDTVDLRENKTNSKPTPETFPSPEISPESPGRVHSERSRRAQDVPVEGGLGEAVQEKTQAIQFEEDVAIQEACIENAGLVLLWPYLSHLLKHCELLLDGKFVDETAHMRSIHLLQYLATGEQETPEYFLMLNKLLCGWDISKPVSKDFTISDAEKAEAEKLLSTAITHWAALKNTSIKGFRTAFLQREGILLNKENSWVVQVERKAYDLLLERLPWSISMIKLSWMKTLLYVEW